jgi:hypothetical protein
MTIKFKILLVFIFLAIGIFSYWNAKRQVKAGFSTLEVCQNNCKVEKKIGQLVPYSSTQISKRGDFIGPLKCQCV